MQTILRLLAITVMLFGCGIIFAAQPIITYNVVVKQNTDAAHCPASWGGESGNDILTEVSGQGINDGIDTAGIESCTDCAFDAKTHNCVCKTCYGYYD